MILCGAIALWPDLLMAMQRARWAAAAVGILTFTALDHMGVRTGVDPGKLKSLDAFLWCMASASNVLAWVVAAVTSSRAG